MDVLTAPAPVGLGHAPGPVKRQHAAGDLDPDHVDVGLQLAIDPEAQAIALPLAGIPFARFQLGVAGAELIDIRKPGERFRPDTRICADPILARRGIAAGPSLSGYESGL
jgi:hypothetical protein